MRKVKAIHVRIEWKIEAKRKKGIRKAGMIKKKGIRGVERKRENRHDKEKCNKESMYRDKEEKGKRGKWVRQGSGSEEGRGGGICTKLLFLYREKRKLGENRQILQKF